MTDLERLDDEALAELLRSDEEAALRWLEGARDEALLADVVRESRALRALREPPRARWAVAAALLIAAATLLLAPPPAAPAVPPGSGLRAEYFERADLRGPRTVRTDPYLDFRGASGTWSARWTGTLRPRRSGLHAFHVLADDGCRLWIDERLVVDHWKDQTLTERSGGAVLAAGVAVPIRLEYFNHQGPGALRLSWSGPGMPKELVPPDVLYPAPPGGTGLRGEYFDALEAARPVLERIDPQVHFEWGHAGPTASDGFRVRWTGALVPRRSGPTTLTVVSDDGCRLWLDGRLVIDDWTVRGTQERSVTLDLDAGRRHPLRLEYFDRVSMSRCSLYWSSAEQPRELIPQSCLHPEVLTK